MDFHARAVRKVGDAAHGERLARVLAAQEGIEIQPDNLALRLGLGGGFRLQRGRQAGLE